MEVTATTFTRNFPRVREEAQHEPVVVKSHNRVAGYFLSARAFEEYQRLRKREGVSLGVEQLPSESVGALRDSRMDDRHAELDRLLDDQA